MDKRADIRSFGVVFYEMLTGERLFQSESTVDTLAAVVNKEPAWNRVPKKVQRLLRRCLEKNPNKRLRDITGVDLLLEEAPAGAGRGDPVLWMAAADALAVVAALALWVPWRSTPVETTQQPSVRLDLDLVLMYRLGPPPDRL